MSVQSGLGPLRQRRVQRILGLRLNANRQHGVPRTRHRQPPLQRAPPLAARPLLDRRLHPRRLRLQQGHNCDEAPHRQGDPRRQLRRPGAPDLRGGGAGAGRGRALVPVAGGRRGHGARRGVGSARPRHRDLARVWVRGPDRLQPAAGLQRGAHQRAHEPVLRFVQRSGPARALGPEPEAEPARCCCRADAGGRDSRGLAQSQSGGAERCAVDWGRGEVGYCRCVGCVEG